MFGLMRYSPLGEMKRFRQLMDEFFREEFPDRYLLTPEMTEVNWIPTLDLLDEGDHYLVRAEVPGVKKEELDVVLKDNILTIKGESRKEVKEEKKNYHRQEISYGRFMRTVQLPGEVNSQQVEASLKEGILSLKLPKLRPEVPKESKIKIVEG